MSASTATIPAPAPLDGCLLGVEGLTRSFDGRRVLDGVSFAVKEGEFFGFLGPNGAGKSTAFSILTGLLRAESGRVFFDGEELGPLESRFRAALGVVFQKASVDGKLTARENLDLGAALHGVPRAVRQARIAQLLEFAELADRADEPVERFSGGMRRRLALVRALVHGPRLLLMDEPTQGLDEGSFQRFWAKLRAMRTAERLTVLLTTHRADEAEQCDRLAVLDGGRIIACDTPDNLRAHVGGDVITLEAEDAGELLAPIASQFGVKPQLVDRRRQFESAQAHALIPRLVEALPRGRLKSVAMRRPTLADAFLKLTGRTLADETRIANDGKKKERRS